MTYVEPIMRRNFLEYASYVIVDRAIPDIRDGCKPVQRRILHTLSEMDDGRFHKVANVIGETMKLHPHGDASIGDALVVLANKEYFIEKQGNFGNLLTGHPAAAARYIECRLTDLARETLFHPDLTEYAPSYDGRKEEPVSLPSKLPVVLLLGTEGIAVGMATRILPHNFNELLEAQIRILQKKKIRVVPDFPQGGIVDVSEYDDGAGRVRVRARIEAPDEKTVVVREIPYSTTTESVIQSIEAAAAKGKLKVSGIEDRTAETVEIVVTPSRGTYAADLVPQLFAYTECEVPISSNLVVIRDGRPVTLTVTQILEDLTERLRAVLRRELEHEIAKLDDRRHALTLEQIFIENRVYKRIEKAKTAAAVRKEVVDGMAPFAKQFVRPMVDADVDRLLEIRIRRISAYDIEKNRREIGDIVAGIAERRGKLERLTETTIAWLRAIRRKYGEAYPRRSKIEEFEAVDKKAVALQNVKVSYDPESGFFGTEVRGSEHKLTLTEFDKILVVSQDGSYRILVAPAKKLIPERPVFVDRFDDEKGQILTLLYTDKAKRLFAKKVHIERYIREKEYELIKGRAGRIQKLFAGEPDLVVHMTFAPARGQKVKEARFPLKKLDFCGIAARGTRLSLKPIAQFKLLRRK